MSNNCRTCSEPGSNCPNEIGEACCLICYEAETTFGHDWHPTKD